jgi:regulator of sirC expression with transglutaminase-like and TPR domain
LVHVIQSKSGLPISLSCIYILVGHRLNMPIGGCNWPGHFLALTYARNNLYVVDCFNGGKTIDEESFLKKQGPSRDAASSLLHHEAGAEIIMQRVLANLTKAYKLIHDSTNQLLMADLLEIHERMIDGAPHS